MPMRRSTSDTTITLGGLLLFWGLVAEVYILNLHVGPAGCAASSVALGGACHATWGYLLIPTLLGLLLLLVGIFNRPVAAEAKDLLHTDPFTRAVLACFFTLTAIATVALGALLIQDVVNGIPAGTWTLAIGTIGIVNALGVIAAVAGLVFAVGYGINLAHLQKRRRFLWGYSRTVARHRQRGSA